MEAIGALPFQIAVAVSVSGVVAQCSSYRVLSPQAGLPRELTLTD